MFASIRAATFSHPFAIWGLGLGFGGSASWAEVAAQQEPKGACTVEAAICVLVGSSLTKPIYHYDLCLLKSFACRSRSGSPCAAHSSEARFCCTQGRPDQLSSPEPSPARNHWLRGLGEKVDCNCLLNTPQRSFRKPGYRAE
ncbi:hypothetical protein DL89DRAFT_92775 [Linderina pennispora]|uniref:Secreted protein n=1 Tax=Linderina pennispora TaxID=61395 RepID=A0A1Y1VXT3_9FUNG|nr:uncharacterized protein DL89DRAFT_92775 [Linderina pennispora]ORX65835.1 hypothetical protein DL89DRAFT_92775 [Linderina pennispora]